VLSEFRTRLVQGHAEQGLLDTLLERVREVGLLKTRGRQRTDSTHVLAAVRMLNRLERVGETPRAALNALAVLAPEWLQQRVPPEWFERYSSRVEHDDLPKTEAARQALALVIGEDGQRLLQAIDRATDQPWLEHVPAMITLRRIWSEQYTEEHGQLRWREVKEMPAAADQLTSPYDTDARYSTKRHMEWIGYKVHFTETCDANTPRLIVNVETTPATTLTTIWRRSCMSP
jgi:transposase